MNFHIDELILWLKDGTVRTLKFENDKINIVTGNSKTGKTAILEIIDYCLCAHPDTATVSYEHIGENVIWYGIRFHINDKFYTVARGAITQQGKKFSSDYYFSQKGDIPDIPDSKIEESELKSILEPEFSIDDNVALSYGGRSIKKNSYLSFRFFLMFNTLSKDIIDNGRTFFDKMFLDRYRDAWPQIFDLSTGVIDFNVVKSQEAVSDLKQQVFSLEQEKRRVERRKASRSVQLELLVKKAKEAQIIDESLSLDDAYAELLRITHDNSRQFLTNYSSFQEYERIQSERDDVALQLKKLKRFMHSYKDYKNRLRLEEDALLPISYIKNYFGSKTSEEYRLFLENLSVSLERIRGSVHKSQPFEHDISRKIRDLTRELHRLDTTLLRSAHVQNHPVSIEDRLISLGEIKAEMKHISSVDSGIDEYNTSIASKVKEIDRITASISSVSQKRQLIIETLNEYIQFYISLSRNALDEYGSYLAWFDYEKAALTLRRPKSTTTANVSSSSDHLFMHLCLFCGLHHMLLMQNSAYIPTVLLIDQPSRPYYNSDANYDYSNSEYALTNKDDWSKVKNIFSVLDSFISIILKEEQHFQIIMLEHVSEKAWEDCENVHLVEVFDGVNNALIPPKYAK